jgi:hypothetical protein
VSVTRVDVGDSNNNVYVGLRAGNAYNVLKDCSNVTALGYSAGSNISNVSNSVYLGYAAGANNTAIRDNIAIGSNAGNDATIGSYNILIGSDTKSAFGTSNILLGHGISASNVSNQVRIGLSNQIPIAADVSTIWVGLGGPLTPVDANNKLDVSGNVRIQGQLGINITPGNRTLDVNGNFRATDASGNILDFQGNGLTRSTGGFTSIHSNVFFAGFANIGPIRKGIIHVSTVDRNNSASRAAYIYFAWSTTNVTVMSSTSNGSANITTSLGNIQLSNSASASTYDYSITYFPMP